jgi:hypothetical protein
MEKVLLDFNDFIIILVSRKQLIEVTGAAQVTGAARVTQAAEVP